MQYAYIAIEGNIGSGKTTLAHALAKHYNARLLLEQFADNPFLVKFYEDRDRYAFPVELSFLAERYNQQKEILLSGSLFQEKIVADYTLIKSQLFARNNLDKAEYNLFLKLSDIIKTTLPKPDLLIYLHTPVQQLQEQIKRRGRTYEQQIEDEYLLSIEQAYLQYLQQQKGKLILVDAATVNLTEPEQLQQFIHFIETANFSQHITYPLG